MIQAPPWGKAAQQRVPSQRQARRNPDLIRRVVLVAVKDICLNYKTPLHRWQREVFRFDDRQSLPFLALPPAVRFPSTSLYFRLTAALFLVLFTTLMVVDRPIKIEKRIVERQEIQGKEAPTHWLVPVWLWRGLAVNTALAGLLVALTPLARRSVFAGEPPAVPPSMPFFRREKMLLAAAVLLLAASTAPRLGHSLWGDEEYAMKTYIAPEIVKTAEGGVQLKPRSWVDTLWDYQRPTNHIGFTVLARVCHDTFFTPGIGPTDPWFSETLMRLPSFFAGLASILTLVWGCRVWGLRQGIGWIALGFAGHAWLVRFGCDARGYGFIVLLVPVLLGTLGRAAQTGRWRWWLGFALTQFAILWIHPGAIHTVAAANALAVALVWRHPSGQRLALAARWLVAGLVTALLVIGLMAPCLPPFLDFMKQNVLQGELDLPWYRDAAAVLFSGALWHSFDTQNPLALGLYNTPYAAVWMSLGGLTAALGAWRLGQDRERRWLLIFILLGPALLIAHLDLGNTRPYHWYLIPILPNLFLLWAAAWPNAKARFRFPQMALVLATLAGVHLLALPTARLLTRFPIEACRESVALTRSITNPRHPDYGKEAITASPGMMTEAYDPAVTRFKTAEELRALIERARSEKKPLFINFGYRALLADAHPAIFALIDDPALFERVQLFPGQFFSATREVYRLRTVQD